MIVVDQLSGLALPTADAHARMPNVGKLTESGVLFSHAYTAGMTCGPSRASLDTGFFTQTHGVGGGFRQGQDLPSLTGTLANVGYVSSHPDGYNLEAERAVHEKWLVELGYDQPLSSINGAESLARTSVALLSMPDSNHEVPIPVPVPNSSRRPPGFDAANTCNSAPVRSSDAMLKPCSSVRAWSSCSLSGRVRNASSNM